ncbi:MAG: (2Fe-2S)-binding protein [Lachnospiraceae bacterium]|nr:(2Fe-2S)-binding protein [Lachnospiraceae bacterium]
MDENEIICSCMGTTVRDIMDAVENGAKTLEEVQAVTQVGTVCGACLDDVEALIKKLTDK